MDSSSNNSSLLNDEYHNYTKEIDELKKKIKAKEDDRRIREDQLKQIQEDRDSYIKELSSINKQITQLGIVITNKTNELDEVKNQVKGLIEEEIKLKKKNEQQNAIIENYNTSRNEYKENLNKLYKEKGVIDAELRELEKEFNEFKAVVDQTKNQHNLNKLNLAQHKNENKALKQSYDELIQTNLELTLDIDKTKRSNFFIQKGNKELEKEVEQKNKTKIELIEVKQNKNKLFCELNKQLQNLKKEIANLDSLNTEHTELFTQVSLFMERMQKVIDELSGFKRSLSNKIIVRKVVGELKENLQNIQTQTVILKQENMILENENEMLNKINQTMTGDLDKLKAIKKNNEKINKELNSSIKNSKSTFIDSILNEVKQLRSLKMDLEIENSEDDEKAVEILKLIKEEQEEKRVFVCNQNEQTKINTYNENLFINEYNESSLGENSLKSNNVYKEGLQTKLKLNLLDLSKIEKKEPIKKKSSLLSRNLTERHCYVVQKERPISIDKLALSRMNHSFKHFYEGELGEHWKNIIKLLQKIVSIFIKNSLLTVNTTSFLLSKQHSNTHNKKLKRYITK